MFLAEFVSNEDMQRVINGSPWVVGKSAILLKLFDPMVNPADVVFDRLLIWARIYGLPFFFMNNERGIPLAGMIGDVDHLEVDENGRAWGPYLHARISIEVVEPLMRCVAVESPSQNKTIFYEVKYEKLPMYCFSCGLIGHSSLVCATPAERDEEGKLPWNKDRVCVPEEWKKDPRSSYGHGSNSGQGASSQPAPGGRKNVEVTSPSKPRKPRARKQPAGVVKDIVTTGEAGKTVSLKRKTIKVYQPKNPQPVLAIANSPAADGALPLATNTDNDNFSREGKSDDSNKKQKNSSTSSTLRSTDLAEADVQPRQTQ
jgi:hypothetical protein